MRANELDVSQFTDQNTVLVTSFRRDGTPVGTPVHIAVEDDRAFFRSYDQAWKTKRIRRNPVIEIAPCTMRGRPTGPAMQAQARILAEPDAIIAAEALARKYPVMHRWLIPFLHRRRGYTTVHFEVEPLPAADQAG